MVYLHCMFDSIVVTAANAAQARGYRAQLRGRAGYVVVPDVGGRRIGSLGATVNVLRRLKRLSGRVLICHSGGDARRTPAYAAMGKAFVPLGDGRPMLDHIVEAMDRLPDASGVTVCCGDVVPLVDFAKVTFAPRGVTGVAYPDGPDRARRHGVYVAAKSAGLHAVEGFLQKPRFDGGRHLVDTGIMHFDWKTAKKMLKLPVAGDIYDDFPKMLLAGFAPFAVSVVPKCEFLHVGSSRELLALVGKGGQLIDACRAPIARLGGDNIVTNVPASYGEVSLGRGECLTSLPLGKDGWYHLKYRIGDDFKTDGLWEKHGLGEKMKNVNHARLLALRRAPAIRVTAPVRIDLAGGWSDTPPICYAEGGTVLAAAVTLDGRRPVEVIVKERGDRLVKVVSRDLGKRRILRSAAEIADHSDPHDWCCLVKSALAVTGFAFGSRGLDITISADLPKGSGMGTSSILGAATIAALIGRTDADEIGELTLRLEQEMRTGGGWEDQFAGITPGVKVMRSRPGVPQKVRVTALSRWPKELEERSLLYFTGQKRMARNVLRRVIGFYAENPHGIGSILIHAVKDGAEKAYAALSRGDMEAFAECVNGYWRDKKLLDAGSTNERVEAIVERVRPHAAAVSLAGAGGGGFMYILAKSAAAARRIREELGRNPPARHSRFYDFAVDTEGLRLETI